MSYPKSIGFLSLLVFAQLLFVANAGLIKDANDNNGDWSGDIDRAKWMKVAENNLEKVLSKKLNNQIGKNMILFLGDGMGISTVTAGRIRKGQQKGNTGEEEKTYMESLDDLALSKTYNIDAQTADSAGTATAYLTGVKSRIGVIGVDGTGVDCASSEKAKLESIIKWAHDAGKSTGIVTTARVTHATPAAGYAGIFNRDMESWDNKNFNETDYNNGCRDIASQFVENAAWINLVFAGGRMKFLPKDEGGDRMDGKNLVNQWTDKMNKTKNKFKYLSTYDEFQKLKPSENYQYILGLMSMSHMQYEDERIAKDPIEEPSIIEMTEKAIQILSRNPKGFFLLVEGGKIDLAHHDSVAKNALDDFVVFDNAIGKAKNITSSSETLITVTADHSHVFTMGGYAFRGNSILGVVQGKFVNVSELKLTFSSLLYGNGPGFYNLTQIRSTNLTSDQTSKDNYKQESAIPLSQETHGGEDVAIFSSGPMSYLFDGTVEQNYIAHVMAYSTCIGPYNKASCREKRGGNSDISSSQSNMKLLQFKSILILVISLVSFAKINY